MPAVNHVAISAGVVAISLAVAAAIAVYESPELRRMADDLRRRIAVALHSLSDGITPNEPRFNRPEDAEGFMMSSTAEGPSREAGVDADEESRRKQREELLYWNRLHLEKKEKERAESEAAVSPRSLRGSAFEDFLQEDRSADKGTYVFNTGADVGLSDEGLVRRRGAEGVRGLNASLYANPFGDEHGIDTADESAATMIMFPDNDEAMSDIYNASEPGARAPSQPQSEGVDLLFDMADHPQTRTDGANLLERDLSEDEFMTAGQGGEHSDAYASIQAWAESHDHQGSDSQNGFYSPLPETPQAPLSEPEVVSVGVLTPTDSVSEAGSGEDIANEARSERSATEGRYFDVLSDDGEGVPTPSSWSEVGSVVSESDAGAVHA